MWFAKLFETGFFKTHDVHEFRPQMFFMKTPSNYCNCYIFKQFKPDFAHIIFIAQNRLKSGYLETFASPFSNNLQNMKTMRNELNF